MFWPPLSVPPAVASGEACSLISAIVLMGHASLRADAAAATPYLAVPTMHRCGAPTVTRRVFFRSSPRRCNDASGGPICRIFSRRSGGSGGPQPLCDQHAAEFGGALLQLGESAAGEQAAALQQQDFV